MDKVIKNPSGFVPVTGAAPTASGNTATRGSASGKILKAGFTASGTAQGVLKPGGKSKSTKFVGAQYGFEEEDELPPMEIVEDLPVKSREEQIIEAEMLKQTYINEGVQARNEAKAWADKMIAAAKTDIAKMYHETGEECERLRNETLSSSYKEGYDKGFAEGEAKGYDEGYNKGLRKCKDTMKELVAMIEELPRIKEESFRKHERDLFDAIFTIANKITVDSLKQKDKAVISKMLKQAAKEFRNSEYIKITLSKLDVEEMATADYDSLKDIFREGQHVEFEVVRDAPQGTMILDNGSEIIDAGIATQLKMIENLGKGKFREAPKDEDDD